MAEQLGGKVESSRVREFGYAQVQAHGQAAILADIKDHLGANGESLLDVWMSHGDKVVVMPEGFALMASTPVAPLRACITRKTPIRRAISPPK